MTEIRYNGKSYTHGVNKAEDITYKNTNMNNALDTINSNIANKIGFIDTDNIVSTLTTSGATYTPTEDVWCVAMMTSATGNAAFIYVNGVKVASQPKGGATSRAIIPVKAGQELKTDSSGSYEITFYKMLSSSESSGDSSDSENSGSLEIVTSGITYRTLTASITTAKSEFAFGGYSGTKAISDFTVVKSGTYQSGDTRIGRIINAYDPSYTSRNCIAKHVNNDVVINSEAATTFTVNVTELYIRK